MLFDPRQLLSNLPLTLGTLAVVLIGKPLAAYAVTRLLRRPAKTAVSVGLALGQIGEFSFILAALAHELGILPPAANQAIVAASIVSITLNPLFFRFVDPISSRIWPADEPPPAPRPSTREQRAIVVGYGPIGRTLTRLLVENELVPTVVEMNLEVTRDLRSAAVNVIYGDAAQQSILEQAGVRDAASLIFAASGSPPEAVVNTARRLNPQIRILARSQYASEIEGARKAGADIVVAAEVEVAIAMAENLLSSLGATGEQLDRVRQRVRSELSGS